MLGAMNSNDLSLKVEQFEEISSIFFAHAGIRLGKTKLITAQSRLKPRINELGLSNFDEYLNFLKGNSGVKERAHFCNALTTNTTSFFRENHHFQHLQQIIEANQFKNREINIWSAGCSSGQEPYSIAMILKSIKPAILGAKVRLLATDLNTQELSKAREGNYPIQQAEKIPSKYHKFLNFRDDQFQFSNEIRNTISFRQLNMFEEWPISIKFDFIFCRNVMIYFEAKRRDELFSKFVEKLNPGGFLYLGHSESSLNATDQVEAAGTTTFRRLK